VFKPSAIKGTRKKHKSKKTADNENAETARESWSRHIKRPPPPKQTTVFTPTEHVPTPKMKGLNKTKRQNSQKLGLRNTRNTCWLNACIQSMAAVPVYTCTGNDQVHKQTQSLLEKIREHKGAARVTDPRVAERRKN